MAPSPEAIRRWSMRQPESKERKWSLMLLSITPRQLAGGETAPGRESPRVIPSFASPAKKQYGTHQRACGSRGLSLTTPDLEDWGSLELVPGISSLCHPGVAPKASLLLHTPQGGELGGTICQICKNGGKIVFLSGEQRQEGSVCFLSWPKWVQRLLKRLIWQACGGRGSSLSQQELWVPQRQKWSWEKGNRGRSVVGRHVASLPGFWVSPFLTNCHRWVLAKKLSTYLDSKRWEKKSTETINQWPVETVQFAFIF